MAGECGDEAEECVLVVMCEAEEAEKAMEELSGKDIDGSKRMFA